MCVCRCVSMCITCVLPPVCGSPPVRWSTVAVGECRPIATAYTCMASLCQSSSHRDDSAARVCPCVSMCITCVLLPLCGSPPVRWLMAAGSECRPIATCHQPGRPMLATAYTCMASLHQSSSHRDDSAACVCCCVSMCITCVLPPVCGSPPVRWSTVAVGE